MPPTHQTKPNQGTHVAGLPLKGEEERAEGLHHLGEQALVPRHHQHLALQEEEGEDGQHVAHVEALEEPREAQVQEREPYRWFVWFGGGGRGGLLVCLVYV